MRRFVLLILWLGLAGALLGQGTPAPSSSSPGQDRNSSPTRPETQKSSGGQGAATMAPPRSDSVQADELGTESGQSSSKDTQKDLSPPDDDARAHPQSSTALAEAEAEAQGGVTEFHTWDPHKAAKSLEVGDFYFKRKNYRAAEDRYREALRYKDNDAVATFRLAVCLEKLGILDEAQVRYESYLKILPHGPESEEAQRSIERLKAPAGEPKP
jgi:Flp pilus assembly protein TadD